MRLIHRMLAVVVLLVVAFPPAAPAAPADDDIDLFQTGSGNGSFPRSIAAGPDGNVWITTMEPGWVIRFGLDGHRTVFPSLGGLDYLTIRGFSADGALWYDGRPGGPIDPSEARVVRMTAEGLTTPYPSDWPTGTLGLLGPDGRVWRAGSDASIVRGDPADGSTALFATKSAPSSLVNGPDGNLWFVEAGRPSLARMTRTGQLTEFPLPAGSVGRQVVAGIDGLFWVLLAQPDGTPSGLVRVDVTGTVVAAVPVRGAIPGQVAAAADGNLWGTGAAKALVRISPRGTYSLVSGLDGVPYTLVTNPRGAVHFLWSGPAFGYGRAMPVGPAIGTAPAVAVTDRRAALIARTHPHGVGTRVRFEYGLTTDYGQVTPSVDAGDGDDQITVTSAIDDLLPSTTYHARAVAESVMGVRRGEDVTFTTDAAAPAPRPGPDPVSGASGPSDDDRDGFPAGVDCDERNAAIHPGAIDRPGDDIDQDCANGPATWPRYEPHPDVQWAAAKGRAIVFTRFALDVLPAGAKVTLTCRGKGCTFKTKVTTYAKAVRHKSLLASLKHARLRKGAVLELRATLADHVGRVIRWTIGPPPRQTIQCLLPGEKKPEACD